MLVSGNAQKSTVTQNVTNGCLYKRSGSRFWWYKYTDQNGKVKYVSTRTPHKGVALEFIKQINHRLKLAKLAPSDTLAGSIQRFFATNKENASYGNLKTRLTKFIVTIKDFEDINRPNILRFLDGLRAEIKKDGSSRYAPRTVIGYLTAVSAFCTYLHKRNILPDNPCSGLRSDLPKPHQTPPRFLDKREYDIALRLAKRAGIYLEVLTALKTGLRMTEIRLLRWEHVHWNENGKNLITVPKDKARRGRTIPLHPDLATELEQIKKHSGPVFKGQRGGHVGDKQWRELLKPLQYWIPKFQRSGHKGTGTGWHLFRHTFGYRMAAAGTPIPILKEIMGHADIATTMIYARMAPNVWYDEINNA